MIKEQRHRAQLFLVDLYCLFEKHEVEIDCHAEFVGRLEDKKTGDLLAILFGPCNPEWENEDTISNRG